MLVTCWDMWRGHMLWRRRRVVRLDRIGMPERVLITRPTYVQGEVRCLALPTDRVVYGITIHYPRWPNKESRTKHLSGVARATSQRSHGNIILRQPKGKRDVRFEMVQVAHGAAPVQRYEYYQNAPNRVRVTTKANIDDSC